MTVDILWAEEWLYAKGHIDKAAFLAEASSQYGLREDDFSIDDVEHTYLRVVPAVHYTQYDALLYRTEPGRGAFAATLLEI